MDDPLVVHYLHAARDLHGELAGAQRIDAVSFRSTQDPAERRSLDILHDQVGPPIGQQAIVSDVYDVGVGDLRCQLRLLEEATLVDLILLFEQDFHRYDAA